MSYFNPRLRTEVIVEDLFGERWFQLKSYQWALSDVESRYSQTEREMLGVLWAVEHFHLYLYGWEFVIATDHKPLLGILNSHKPTLARIDRWKLRLMPYNCQLVYRPGKDTGNPADFMSRHPCNKDREECIIAEDYTNWVCNQAMPKDVARNQVRLGEGHFAPSTYQGRRDWPVDTSRSTGVQKCERWTVGPPRNFTEGKQDRSPESARRQSRGPCSGHQGNTKTKRFIKQQKSLVSRCRLCG